MRERQVKQTGVGFLANLRYRRKWKWLTSVLSVFVVLGTISSLMLPAIALNQYACGEEEHVHGNDCYSITTERILSCNYDSLGVHRHSSPCYDGERNEICGIADVVVHKHDEKCFNAEGTLVCRLQEVKEHRHGDSCYQPTEVVTDEGHTHGDDCYQLVTSESATCGIAVSDGHQHGDGCYAVGTELICTAEPAEAHTHGDSCFTTEDKLTCVQEVSPGHAHDDSCCNENGELVCGRDESSGHSHDGACYSAVMTLVCTTEETEGHEHGAECYAQAGTLLCTVPEDPGHQHTEKCFGLVKGELLCTQEEREPVTEPGEPILICEKPQVILHTHKGTCYEYDGQGNPVAVICGGMETLAHQHSDACFTDREVKTLICKISEHTHTEACRLEETLTAEEQTQVDSLILAIDGLPAIEDINTRFTEFDEAEDTTGREAYQAELTQLVIPAFDKYHSFTEDQKAAVSNAPKLLALKWLLPEEETVPELTEEEQALGTVIAQIEALPEAEALAAELAALDEARNLTDWTAAVASAREKAQAARNLYAGLPEENQAAVTNLQKLIDLETLLAGATAPTLPEEERGTVEALIALIDALPTAEELANKPATLEEGQDNTGNQDLIAQVEAARKAYNDLNSVQQAAVTNEPKLAELEAYLLADEPPALTEEEQTLVNAIMARIEELPDADSLSAALGPAILEDNLAGWRTGVQTASEQAVGIRAEYDALPENLQAAVTNIERLTDLEKLLTDWKIGELTDQELWQIDTVNVLIAELIPYDEYQSEAERLEAEGDTDGLAAHHEKCIAAAKSVLEAYDELTDVQKQLVREEEKLVPYRRLLMELGVLEPPVHTVRQYTDATFSEVYESDVSITIQGLLPEGAEARAFPVEKELQDAQLLATYDISIFLEDGSPYQPEAPVKVEVSGLTPPEKADLVIYYIQDTGRFEPMESSWSGDKISFETTHFSVYTVADVQKFHSLAEQGDPEAVQALIDSGFFTYWSSAAANQGIAAAAYMDDGIAAYTAGDGKPSDSQITKVGGSKTDGTVTVSKTIDGTDVENVFDITLTVNTTTNITELQKDPDMAVVIVMDISNTMNESFGGSTRYKAAMESAEAFLDKFAAANNGYSRIGYVAFNTDAHQIFGLSECSTTAQADALKNTMRTKTGNIISAAGYGDSHSRFTNVEAGLKRGYDMLKNAPNDNKYIIFLSDGFPTTYVKSGYTGYDPYTSSGTKGADGVFYDYVTGYYCEYGTSYSDKASIRAREMAWTIKNADVKIFSIGIDVGGQTIDGHDHREGLSVIDRTSKNYELGSATDANAFKNWLGNSIGSGYYYDSTDTAGLQTAYDEIFAKIKSLTEEANALKWIASDPIPNELEFIGFYNNKDELQVFEPTTSLVGKNNVGGENMISYDQEYKSIAWNLKQSGYTISGDDPSKTSYHYKVTYRVRLRNELDSFVEHRSYNTNGTTSLTYQNVTKVDGNETISGDKTVEFPIPAVKGYLGELTFKKVTNDGNSTPLAGAEFTLSHDSTKCPVCRGDGLKPVSAVVNNPFVQTSGTDGIVTFEKIPSGHTYTLVETKVPAGYHTTGSTYSVNVAYDQVTVTETSVDGTVNNWNLTSTDLHELVNETTPVLPNTGGRGTHLYTVGGGVLVMLACLLLMYNAQLTRRKGVIPPS